MKKIQPHFEEVLKKLNIISKKQSHMKIMTATLFRYLIKIILVIVFTFGALRALYTSISGRSSPCLTKINFQVYVQGNYWKELVLMKKLQNF